jgi:hypothetical protein
VILRQVVRVCRSGVVQSVVEFGYTPCVGLPNHCDPHGDRFIECGHGPVRCDDCLGDGGDSVDTVGFVGRAA